MKNILARSVREMKSGGKYDFYVRESDFVNSFRKVL